MTVHVIKAITKRIRLRYGSTEAAGIAGIPMAELCDRFVQGAFARGATRRNVALPLPR